MDEKNNVMGLRVPELSEKMPCGHSLSRLVYRCETCDEQKEASLARLRRVEADVRAVADKYSDEAWSYEHHVVARELRAALDSGGGEEGPERIPEPPTEEKFPSGVRELSIEFHRSPDFENSLSKLTGIPIPVLEDTGATITIERIPENDLIKKEKP